MDIKLIAVIAILSVLGFFVLIYVLSGLKKGLKKTIIRLIFMIISIIVTVLVTKFVLKIAQAPLIGLVDNLNIAELNELREASPTLEDYTISLVSGIIAPVLFFLLFIIICPLMKIFAAICNRVFRSEGVEEKPSLVSKLISVALGVVCAVVMTFTLFMPIFAYVNLAVDVYTIANEDNVIQFDETTGDYVDQVIEIKKSPLMVTGYILTKPISASLLSMEDPDGDKTSVNKELDTIAGFVPVGVKLSEMKIDDISNIDITPVNELIAVLNKSDNLKAIVAEIFKTASTKWKNNEEFLTINIKSAIGSNDLDEAIDVILDDFTKSTGSTINKDLTVLTMMLESVTSLYGSLNDLDFENFENIDVAVLNSSISKIENDGKLTQVVAKVLSSLGTKLYNEEPFMGQDIMGGIEPELKNSVKIVFEDFKNTDETSVITDLKNFSKSLDTLSDIYSTLNTIDFDNFENVNIADFELIKDKVEDDAKISQIVNQLLVDAGTAWDKGDAFMGINIKSSMPAGFENAFDSTIELFKNPNKTAAEKLDSFNNALRAYKYAESLSKGSANAQDIKDFVNNLNQDNAEIMKDLVSKDVISQVGGTDANGNPAMTEEDADAISSILQQTIDNIVNPNITTSEEDREKEAEALNQLIAFSNNLSTGESTDPEQTTEVSAYDMLSTVMESNALSKSVEDYVAPKTDQLGNPVVVEPITLDEGQTEELNNAINEYVAAHAGSENDPTLDSIRQLFNLNAAIPQV